MNMLLQVNGAPVQVEAEPGVMLLEVLRDQLGLLGARGTCGVGLCGACTVLLDGEPISSCIMLAPLAQGHAITTVEGVPDDDPVVQAFDRHHAFQCGRYLRQLSAHGASVIWTSQVSPDARFVH